MTTIEDYKAPRSLEEAAEILRGGNVTILAGGTDLMPQTRAGARHFAPVLMNIRRVKELAGIVEEGGIVRLGAGVTVTELLQSALVRGRLNLLWQACDHFASDQIRNAATIGGNLCNASPAGDTLVPLLALEAQVVLASKPNGTLQTRRVPLNEFFAGPGRTCRAPAELLTAVEVPLPPAGFAGAFYKHGTRPALDISTISIAAGMRREGNVMRDVRIAFGAVAPTPIRAPRTEAALEGRAADVAAIEAAAQAALEDAMPISDVRASDWYRRELIRNMLKRVLSHVCQL
ncbi:MAG: xanthine dehydrogenase family protein subunit M [Alphaproteobacteria bacterium]|nr:xanthine dehydrogenase family protein subunit M [Alphaproteobacteria bacterium]MDE2013879.1 xanthine dehydrogenase family protein subunit M [Alphaproteobacteria bacterium]MDE2074167.1 xanthine dehydrogenase family protein subunit M [Alphaproteobacteria bacterium]